MRQRRNGAPGIGLPSQEVDDRGSVSIRDQSKSGIIGRYERYDLVQPVERRETALKTLNRLYAGAADLRRMEESLARAYSNTSLRVGDLS